MTMIEVVIAIMLLSGALLGMGAFLAQFAKAGATMQTRTTANQLVADRLEEVKGAVRYAAIDSLYAKTEASIPNSPGFTRQTLVSHVGGGPPDLVDYRIVTVIVTSPSLKRPAKKTTIISAF